MTQLISVILLGLEEAIRLAPGLIADIMGILGKNDPTAADWQALRDKVNAKGYFDYVPQSDLPSPTPQSDLPPP